MKNRIIIPQTEKTFRESYQEFLIFKKQEGVSPKTLKTYSGHFNMFDHLVDTDTPVFEFNFPDLFLKLNQHEMHRSSKASYLRVLRTFINWLNKTENYSFPIPKVKEPKTYKETYTDEELSALIKQPPRTCNFCTYRNWCIILILIDTGMRSGSLREIRNKDINFTNNTVILRHVKTGIVQVLPFSITTSNALKKYTQYRKGSEDDYFFCDQCGDMLSERALILAIKRYNISRGVKRTSIHAFRHTFSKKFLLDCGGNAFTLQKMLGHTTLTMTEHYCHIFSDDLLKSYSSPLESLKKERIKKGSQL